MTYPANPAVDLRKHYVRYRPPSVRGPAATAAFFIGERTEISTMARFDAGAGGMLSASDMVWIDVAQYGGFVDIAPQDTVVEIESQYRFAVLAVEEVGPRLMVTLSATGRQGGQ